MAYELATGELPFKGPTLAQLFAQHHSTPIPRIPPYLNVPEGFESWLQRMMAKEPFRRYRHAADAAFGLLSLPPLDGNPLVGNAARDATLDGTTMIHPTFEATFVAPALDETLDGPIPASMSSVRRLPVRPPPMPTSWTEPPLERVWPETGVKLFHYRPIPVIGRAHEQRALWDALGRVKQSGRPQCVGIRGATGLGKSSLASWLAMRSRELGVAHVVWAGHDAPGSVFDGLRGMFVRFFRLASLSYEEVYARAHDWCVGGGYAELADSVATRLAIDVADQGLSVRERVELSYEMLTHLAADRPALLVLDDLDRGTESVPIVRRNLDAGGAPVLIVVTTTNDRPETPVQRAIEGLLDEGGARAIDLDSLALADLSDLLHHSLGLRPSAAIGIAHRAQGNPMLAVSLVRNAVDRQILVPSSTGFAPLDGVLPELPQDVRVLTAQRLEQVIQEFGAQRRDVVRALELAAVLGFEADVEEWSQACDLAGVTVPADFLEVLSRYRLVTLDNSVLRFADSALREALLGGARDEGRFEFANEVCAAALEKTGTDLTDWRRAKFLAAAGKHAESLEPLVQAAERLMWLGNLRLALEILTDFRRNASHVEIPVDDPRILRALNVWAHSLILDDHWQIAPLVARQAFDAAARSGEQDIQGDAHLVLAYWELLRGTGGPAIDHARAAARYSQSTRDTIRLGKILTLSGLILGCYGQRDEALELCDRGAAMLEGCGGSLAWWAVEQGFAVAYYSGKLDEMEAWARRYERLGPRRPVFRDIWLQRVRVFRADLLDDHRLLEREYMELRRLERSPTYETTFWGEWIVQVSRIRHRRPNVDPEAMEAVLTIAGPHTFECGQIRLAQCLLAMRRGDGDGARAAADAAQPAFDAGKVIFVLARDVELAGDEAAQHRFPALAERFWNLAADQWRRLGDVAAHQRVAAKLTAGPRRWRGLHCD